MIDTQRIKIDYTLVSLVIILAIISLVTLYTVQPILPGIYDPYNFSMLQLQWYIAGSVLAAIVMVIDYDRFRKITWFLYPLGLIPLFMVFFKGYLPESLIEEFNGVARGINIPLLGSIQPAEFFKVILVVTLSHMIVSHNEKYVNRTVKSDLGLLLKLTVIASVPMGLIASQPDLGSALVLVFIMISLILVSGIRWRVLFSILLASIVSIAISFILWTLSDGKVATFLETSIFQHVQSRFYGWIYPEQFLESGHQLILSMRAIGSGRLFGKGASEMEVYNIPEQHTDMILTAIGEQAGFIGISFVIVIFFLLIYRMLHIALKSNDHYGTFLVTGLIGMFTYQIFQNIGMSIQLLPITGIPLPFISYGGSSVLAYMISMGIVLNVHSRTKTYMFD